MKLNLTDLQSSVSKRYQSVELGFTDVEGVDRVVNLLPVMRLSEARRAEFAALQDERLAEAKENEQEDEGGYKSVLPYLREFITLTADDEDAVKALLDVIGEDLATLTEIVNEYAEASQPGEAKPSRR